MTNNDKLFEILKTVDVNWFNAAVNISLKGRYVYVENPKVASSTIKSKLHANELHGLRNIRVGPHPDITQSPFIKPYQLPPHQLREILFGGEFFKFTFVRNPFDRFVSSIPQDRPIILAGHSQGALHLTRLLREKVAGAPLTGRIVAAKTRS